MAELIVERWYPEHEYESNRLIRKGEEMLKTLWFWGRRYELSGDGAGLLKYVSPNTFYHIHHSEMTGLERVKHRVLTKLKGKSRYIH